MTTKNLIPRGSGEGGIGIPDTVWGYGYYETGNFNKGLFVSGKNIDEVIADAVTGGGLGGVWNTAPGGIIYYNGGNVGIGTTSPGAELTVTGTVRASKIEALTDTGFSAMFLKTNEQPAIKFTGTPSLNYSLGLKSIDAGNNSFELNLIGDTGLLTSNLLTIKSNGNVGIGTTDPSTRMHIRTSGGSYSSSQGISEGLTIDDADQCSLNFYHSGTGSALSRIVGIKASSGNSDLAFITQNTVLGASTGRQEWMRITHTGNVGIGTTTPSSPLTVSKVHTDGSSGIDNLITLAASEKSGQNLEPGDGVGILFKVPVESEQQNIGARIAGVREGGTDTASSTELTFEVSQNDETLDEAMRIDRDGNVGIGTNSPDAKLEIAGEGHLLKSKAYNLLGAKGRIVQGTTTLYVDQNLTSVFVAGDAIKIEKHLNTISSVGSGAIELTTGYLGTTHTTHTANLYTVDDAMTIDSAGKVIIGAGTNNPPASPAMSIKGSNGISGQLTVDHNAFYIGQNDANRELRLWSGQFTIGAKLVNGSNSFVPFSCDRRSKENIAPLENVLDKVLKLSPSRYDYKEEYGSKDQIGFIAQEVNEVLPEFYIPGSTEDKMSTVKFSDNATTALLVKAIQEQQQLIEDLRSEVEALKNK